MVVADMVPDLFEVAGSVFGELNLEGGQWCGCPS